MNRWDRLRVEGHALPTKYAAQWENAITDGQLHQRTHGCAWHEVSRRIHRHLMDRGWGYARALTWSKLIIK